MAKLHAIEYLAQPDKYPPKPVCVAYGDELFLRRQVLMGLRHAVLGGDEGDFSLTSYEGRNAEFRDVVEELTTMAMFGGQRLVVVDEADEFVTPLSRATRGLRRPARPQRHAGAGRKSWPSNTRLYQGRGRPGAGRRLQRPKAADARLIAWLIDWAKQTHKCQLSPATRPNCSSR